MALPVNYALLDNINDAKLNKSANALELALAHFGKFNASVNDANLASPTNNNADGSGFDEWLAADLQFGTIAGDDLASPLESSPLSALEESPILGFDSFGSELDGASSPLFDMSELLNQSSSPSSPSLAAAATFVPATPMVSAPATPRLEIAAPVLPAATAVTAGPKVGLPVLTTDAVKQAAAALNIPWSDELEKAVIAQAMLPIGSTIPVANNNTSSTASPAPAPATPFVPATPVLAQSPLATAAALAASVPKMVKTNKRGIVVEEPEEVVAKRAKNTDAARRSRLKKLVKLETLEKKVEELETINKGLSLRVAVLESEKNAHLVKDAEQNARIAQLEAKLAEAHLALSQSHLAKLKSEKEEEK
ncbi:hypothetical protein DFQ26_007465 [Actinomortierella ambigua]|nr:hypothetical protein DFQ26_007465 [Actinomortierella ambigua]